MGSDVPATCAHFWTMSSSECASWVQAWAGITQAVGALLALAISVWLSARALGREDEHARRATKVYLDRLVTTVDRVITACENGDATAVKGEVSAFSATLKQAALVRLELLPEGAMQDFIACLSVGTFFLDGFNEQDPRSVGAEAHECRAKLSTIRWRFGQHFETPLQRTLKTASRVRRGLLIRTGFGRSARGASDDIGNGDF